VETVAAHPFCFQRTRQREPSGHWRHGVVERGIEACDLRKLRSGSCNRTHRSEIIRHMQRIERRQRLQLRHKCGCYHFGCDMIGAATHDAVTDGRQAIATQMGVSEIQQSVEGDSERMRIASR